MDNICSDRKNLHAQQYIDTVMLSVVAPCFHQNCLIFHQDNVWCRDVTCNELHSPKQCRQVTLPLTESQYLNNETCAKHVRSRSNSSDTLHVMHFQKNAKTPVWLICNDFYVTDNLTRGILFIEVGTLQWIPLHQPRYFCQNNDGKL